MATKILVLGKEGSQSHHPFLPVVSSLGDILYHSEGSFKRPSDIFIFIYKNKIDIVAMLNPYGSEKRLHLYNLLRKIQFPVLTYDRGGLPDSWFFDVGFNADSPTYSPLHWDNPLNANDIMIVKEYISNVRKSGVTLERQGQRVGAANLRKSLGLNGKNILFVPFQRPHDTTVRYFSGSVRGIPDFIRVVEEIAKLLPLYAPDWVILGKQHPLEQNFLSNSIRIVPPDTHIHDLLEICSAVCLINSGVGLLATLFERPVYHFGESYYSHPKLNRRVSSASDVVLSLRDNLIDFCPETRDRLIHYLRYKVYSFGHSDMEIVSNKDGSFRNVVRHIDFREIKIPDAISNPSQKKRVLFVTPVIPLPINRGSAQRTDSMIRALLRSGVSLTILVLNRSEPESTPLTIEERLSIAYPGSIVKTVNHPRILKNLHKNFNFMWYIYYKIIIFFQRITMDRFRITNENECPTSFRSEIHRHVIKNSYDALYFNYAKVCDNVIRRFSGIKICDTHDVQTNRVRHNYSIRYNPIISRILSKIFMNSERKFLMLFDKLISISPSEISDLKKISKGCADITCIPAFFKDCSFSPESPHTITDILFVGSRSTPNLDSILWFISDVLPEILTNYSELNMRIVGSITEREELLLSIKPYKKNITLINFAQDLDAIYAETRIVVCPVLYGTGMKIKSVEALAHSSAIVGTSVAFDGINVQDGINAMCADDPMMFCKKILELLANSEKRHTMRRAAHTLFMKEHSETANIKKISALLDI